MSVKKTNSDSLFSEITTIPPVLLQKYLPSLDGFRAFSIILVIISHIAFNFKGSWIFKIGLGGFGVNIFFVISGFLITLLLLKEKYQNGKISLKDFYVRRFLRILPVAYLFIIVLVILNLGLKLPMEWGSLLAGLLFIKNFSHQPYWSNEHYWSLSVEEQFYLIFPFIVSLNLKGYLKTTLSLIIIIPITSYIFYHVSFSKFPITNDIVYFFFHLISDGMINILVGSLLAIFLIKYPTYFTFKVKLIVLLQLALLGLSWFFYIYKLPFNINSFISSVFIALLIISTIVNTNGIIYTILNYKSIRYIGMLSFSLYIWQQIFTYQQPWSNSFRYGNSIVINVLFLAIVAIISYHFYEKAFLKLKKKFTKIRTI